MRISSRVLLWLEKSVKIPKGTLNKVVCRHLCKSNQKLELEVLTYANENVLTPFLKRFVGIRREPSLGDGDGLLG